MASSRLRRRVPPSSQAQMPQRLPNFPGFDEEHRALAACALFTPSEDFAARGIADSIRRSDRERLMAGAAAHQLRPQLFSHLQSVGDSFCDASILAQLEGVAGAHEGNSLMLAGGLGPIVRVLRESGVMAVPFKGPAFASLVGSGPRTREMGDLDFLVAVQVIPAAVDALRTLGYQSPLHARALATPWLAMATDELLLSRSADLGAVELHWRLGQRWFPTCVSFSDVEPRTRPVDVLGATVQWPHPEELLLIHAADGLKAGGASLRWAADLVAILARHGVELDWDRVREIASANGGLLGLRAALLVAAYVSGEAARVTGVNRLASAVSPSGQKLLDGGEKCTRAAADMLNLMLRDSKLDGATAHFRWALQLADRPVRVATQVAAYISGPAFADLLRMPVGGEPGISLRWRAFCRRVGAAVA